jgi:hypothetical protein
MELGKDDGQASADSVGRIYSVVMGAVVIWGHLVRCLPVGLIV